MKNTLVATALLLGLAGSAQAGTSARIDQTFGENDYRATNLLLSIDMNKNAYIEPSFNSSRSDLSSGTFRHLGLRVGVDSDFISWGIDGGGTNKVGGYRNTHLGGDVAFTFTPTGRGKSKLAGPRSRSSGAFGKGLTRVDVGGGINFTRHVDDFETTAPRARGSIRRRSESATVTQTDLTIFTGASVLFTDASISITKSGYNRDLEAILARGSQRLELEGVAAFVQGFPDTSFNARLAWNALPMVKPFVSYTRTSFKLGAPDSHSYSFGGTLGMRMIQVRASYNHYVPGGGAEDLDDVTLGASLLF